MGLVGERKATAAAVLALYALIFLIIALSAPDPSLVPYVSGIAAIYGGGFFALVAGYFWARWFAIGLGVYGMGVGALLLWQIGPDPIALFYTGTHGMVSLMLAGKQMATQFDGRTDWRDRYHLDENGTQRLGRAVIRVGISLPVLLAYGLAPRDSALDMLLVSMAVGLCGLGVLGMLRLRTWGILALMGGAIAVLGTTLVTAPLAAASIQTDLAATGTLCAAMILMVVTPFLAPMMRYLRQ